CSVYAEVLGVERVGLDDDFFALGGHSLKAVRALALVQSSLGVDVRMADLFSLPRVRDLASELRCRSGRFARIEPIVASSRYALSSAQRRLWVLSRFERGSTA
ncbi:phosphopantetheine-binding protein, partial [Pelagicoccus sp. SDUM812002]|uniref:phosphopantetheine-binding protein n=1 Tax=Pelagicoccus sp. SDUM812002 TaxID=3041266 RepID=UPI00280CD7D2